MNPLEAALLALLALFYLAAALWFMKPLGVRRRCRAPVCA
jgi:hypothetical protein